MRTREQKLENQHHPAPRVLFSDFGSLVILERDVIVGPTCRPADDRVITEGLILFPT